MKTNKFFATIAALTMIVALGLILIGNNAFSQSAPGGGTQCTDPATGRVVPCPDNDDDTNNDDGSDSEPTEPGLGGVSIYADLDLAEPIRELGPEFEFIAEALDNDDAILFRCSIDFDVLMKLVQQLEENGVENAFEVALNRLLEQCVIPGPGPGVQIIDFIINSPGDDNPPSLLLIRTNDDNGEENKILFLVETPDPDSPQPRKLSYVALNIGYVHDNPDPGFDGLFFVSPDTDDTDTRDVNCHDLPNTPGKQECTNTDGCNDVLSCLEVAIFCWVNEGDYDGDANTCTVDKN